MEIGDYLRNLSGSVFRVTSLSRQIGAQIRIERGGGTQVELRVHLHPSAGAPPR